MADATRLPNIPVPHPSSSDDVPTRGFAMQGTIDKMHRTIETVQRIIDDSKQFLRDHDPNR